VPSDASRQGPPGPLIPLVNGCLDGQNGTERSGAGRIGVAQTLPKASERAPLHGVGALKGASEADGNPIDLAGQTTDVVRRQPDCSWLVAVDNPWGAHAFAATPAAR
jgi:hypothetical protein